MSMYGAEFDRMIERLNEIKSLMRFNQNAWPKQPMIAEQSINRYFMEYYEMAAKAKAKIAAKQTTKKEFVWKGFVNAKLTEDHRQAFEAWDLQDSDVWDGIATYCEAGYKFNVTYNSGNSSFNCTVTGQPECGDNSGWAVSSFAKTPYDASRVTLYKLHAVLPAVWADYAAEHEEQYG